MPSIASPPGTPKRSTNQNTNSKNQRLSWGVNSRTTRIDESPLLGRFQRALRLRAQVRLQGAVAVKPRHRQHVQHERGDLEEPQERHGGPEHRVLLVAQQCRRHQQQHRERQVGERAGEADQGFLTLGHERRPYPHRAAGQSDAADRDDHHGQHDRQQWIRVLEGVERQIAAHRDVVVAEPPRGERVAEFVQAERHHPAGDDEDEHADVGQRPVVVGGQPRQRPADRGQRDDAQEDRAGAHR